jgi:topoisomerase IA-like protein
MKYEVLLRDDGRFDIGRLKGRDGVVTITRGLSSLALAEDEIERLNKGSKTMKKASKKKASKKVSKKKVAKKAAKRGGKKKKSRVVQLLEKLVSQSEKKTFCSC